MGVVDFHNPRSNIISANYCELLTINSKEYAFNQGYTVLIRYRDRTLYFSHRRSMIELHHRIHRKTKFRENGAQIAA